MTTYDTGEFTLHRVREHVWEIPRVGEMNVPARVLASESLLEEISDDKTLQQLVNTTHLPGIQKYAICMPDGHQGYGFPVGGVAGIDAENGCISPGAVGYDINCLSRDTKVTLEFGRRCPLGALEDRFEAERALVAAGEEAVPASIQLFTESEEEPVYEVTTRTDDTVRATADHPFLTPDGMCELADVEPGDQIFVHPFVGLPDENPEEFTVLAAEDFEDEDPQLVRALEERDLLPLRTTDEAFNRLLKLVGFHTGDGAFRREQTWFYGEPGDLEAIADDIEALGFTPSPVYERDREHEIEGNEFEQTEYSLKSGASALKQLLVRLGAPEGPKVEQDFTTPEYLSRLPDWQRSLYLSAFFGAEMNVPAAQHDKNLYCQKVSQNRRKSVAEAGEEFMREISTYLGGMGIETNSVERFDAASREDTERLRLGIKNDSENLIRFYTTVGFRYNAEKQREAAVAAQYLKRKEHAISRRERIASEAAEMYERDIPTAQIRARFDINDRFIERSIWSGRSGRPRPPAEFPTYDEFRADATVRDDGSVAVEVTAIEDAGTEPVHDLGVDHGAHNFLANGFVVSNCGVRMVKTNLSYDDLVGREAELVEALFDAVPSGLGGGGVYEGTLSDIDSILDDGMQWALANDYAVPADLEHCEDEGFRPEADPSKVSKKAKERGKTQVGSLGSGNHFLEVQRVTDIFREDVAAEFGLEMNQIVVLIHCGSRGLGHQVCTDYLREIEQAHQGLLNRLPDRELAAAPAGSQLADDYYGAMCAAINFAWVNRQLITHRTREVFEDVFDREWEAMEMDLLYDVAHNIAKKEVHDVNGTQRELYVHRKGATRAFPAGRPELPPAYSGVGQPIIIPGSMGAGSYVLRGGERSLAETFGSTAHGAGRLMSRTQAKQEFWGGDVQDDLRESQQVYVKAQSGATVAEEAPGVYKDIDEVVAVSDALGIGDKVARTFPVCNIKG